MQTRSPWSACRQTMSARLVVAHQRLHRRRGAEIAKLGPLPGRDIVDLVGSPQRAGARHVLDHDQRIAGNVTPIVPGEDTEVEIGRTAGRVADADIDRFTFEGSRRLRRSGYRQSERGGNTK